ncbi:MAG: permease prefix domain 1-containing protein [Candidatus Helarchaeota archaeon]
MNEKSYANKLIHEFLDEVEERLPIWIKSNESEVKEVLRELEEHIEDKIDALLDSGETYINAVRIAISEMGKPIKIAKEYKRRGTPKYYITEELWPLYLRIVKTCLLIAAVAILIFTTIRSISIGLSGGDWISSIEGGVFNLFFFMVFIFTGISIIFVWLSMEGYTPEDLKDLFRQEGAQHSRKQKSQRWHTPRQNIEPKTPESHLTKRIIPKGFKKPHELIIGGSISLIFGIICVWQPITYLNVLLDPHFLNLLMALGVFWIVISITEILQGIVAIWKYTSYKVFLPTRSVISILMLPVLVLLLNNPQIVPLFWYSSTTGFEVLNISPDFYWLYQLIVSIIIICILVISIRNFFKAAKLKEQDFYE